MSSSSRKLLEILSHLMEIIFNLGHLRIENLDSRYWALTLELLIHTQFLINYLWFEIKTFSVPSRWLFLLLGICSILLEAFSKLIHFLKVKYKAKRIFISIGKLSNSILIMVFFILIFGKNISGERNVKGFTIFNLITNYIITITSLSFAYMSWGYIMIIFFVSFILISGMSFGEKQVANNNDSIQYIHEENHAYLFISNVLSFIIMAILMKKITCSWEMIDKILKNASAGKAIIKVANKQFVFVDERLARMMGKPKIDINFADFNELKYSCALKISEHPSVPSVLYHKTQSDSPTSAAGLQRTNLNFHQILDSLKKAPFKIKTVYTTIENEVVDDSPRKLLKAKEKSELPMSSLFQTDGNLIESEISHLEVKVSYLDWARFKDRYVYIELNDITELKKYMDTERQNEFKTRVLHSFSHELKTPINISRNMIELMIMDEKMPECLKENYACVVKESVDHLDFLIQDIIDFLKIESSHFQLQTTKFCLKALLEEVVMILIKKFGDREIQVFLKTDSDQEYIVATDRSRLKRVFLNVLSYCANMGERCSLELILKNNRHGAYDFTLEKAVPIREVEPESANLKIKTKGIMNSLSVQPENDFGILISRALLTKLKDNGLESFLFDIEPKEGSIILKIATTAISDDSPMQTFEPSIAKIEMTSFRVVDSSLLKFDRKSLTLNSNRRLQDVSLLNDFKIKSNSNVLESARPCPRVLIVDDDNFNLLSINLLLEKINLFSLKATNGAEAITNLTNYHKEHKCMRESCKGIEIILMDLMMPIMNGLDSAKILMNMMEKGEIPKIPIIACTANDSKDVIENCQQIGFKEMLSKPITFDTLRNAVSPLLLS